MAAGIHVLLLLALSAALLLDEASAQVPGFLSLNCGGRGSFIDDIGIEWTPDNQFMFGKTAQTPIRNRAKPQYATLRYFPADSRKYCYTLSIIPGMRYLLRATFLYGNFDGKNVYPMFDISLGATYWSTIVISDVNTMEAREMIFLATEPTVCMCLFNATRGSPFISTLELRQFNESMYSNDFEEQFYLSVSARINFGGDSEAAVRYPDDPFDRIWESDYFRKPNYLKAMADGIINVSTEWPIDAGFGENPPQKVMQTAVVGTNGLLSYDLELNGFPGKGWVVSYFAEIEDLGPHESREFRMAIPFASLHDTDRPLVNIEANAGGKYRLYEHRFVNLSLPFVLSFEFSESPNSWNGPLLNAMEISSYLEITRGSPDAAVAASIVSSYLSADWAQEGGDPCLPVPWSWLHCNSESAPQIISIFLSRKNLTGNILLDLTKLTHLMELWLDGNSFTGPIPDFTNCMDLKIIHLENNKLTGVIPSSMAKLQNLRELYLQNNMLSGRVPSGLLRKNLLLNVSGNINLKEGPEDRHTKIIKELIVIAIVVCACLLYVYYGLENEPPQIQRDEQADPSLRDASVGGNRPISSSRDSPLEAAHRISLPEIEKATGNFERIIGFGGFGRVYHGSMNDGREIAVKVLSSNSNHGEKEFLNEVTILSRVHHANLVELLGFCQENGRSMLVYEYMPKGNLGEHLFGLKAGTLTLSWMQRLLIAEGAAKGIVYLHTECVPAIMHRDLKSNNILLDGNFNAKVADFGLSRFAADGASSSSSSHFSDEVRGTIGYIDPVYLESRRYTEKSDVYSFGLILFELISGREVVSGDSDGQKQHITHWALPLVNSWQIHQVMDGALEGKYERDSAWIMAETAQQCVKRMEDRPSMTKVLGNIKQAIALERGEGTSSSSGAGTMQLRSRHPARPSDAGGQSSH